MLVRSRLPLGEILTVSFRNRTTDLQPGRRSVHAYLRNGMGRQGHSLLMDKPPSRSMSMLDFFRRRKKAEEGAVTSPAGDDNDDETPGQIFDLYEEEKHLTEEEIDAKRNVARLRPDHWNLVHGKPPHQEPIFWFHHTLKYKRRMFGKYGESSGVDPGYMWPTKKELDNRLEFEKVAYPFTIQEQIQMRRAIREAEQQEFIRREKEIDEKMKLVDKFKAELFAKQQAKEDELNATKRRREQLMEEVRRHFGYTVDPKDERFQELLAQKEKQQKKAMKEARKLEKQSRNLERLQIKDEKPSGRKKAEVVEDD